MRKPFYLVLSLSALLIAVLATSCAQPQAPLLTRVAVTGDADGRTPPDTAIIAISVVTQSERAVDAQGENARKSDAVRAAVIDAAGTNPEIRTSNFGLQPQYVYRNTRLPSIIGYEARNSITVSMSDLNSVGAVIDAATRAGANSIENVSFILRGDNPARGATLAEATRQAMSKAEAIAGALGGRIVRVVEEREAGANFPITSDEERARQTANMSNSNTMNAPPQRITPIEAGSLSVSSQVQLVVEIEVRR